MRLNVNVNEFVDIVVLFLFERITKEDEIYYKEDAQEFFEILQKKGLKPYLMRYFFNTDAKTRNKYKFISDIFNEKTSDTNELRISQGKLQEENISLYKELIEETVKKVTGKENINEKKLKSLQEELLSDIINQEGENENE